MEKMSAAERVRIMEARFDRALDAANGLDAAIDRFRAAVPDIEALISYYESDLWRSDFDADAAGALPAGLKRGVLSEDGIYDLLTDYQRLTDLLSNTPGR